MASVTCPAGITVKLADAGESEKSGGAVSKVAVTDSAAFMVTLHAAVPEQAPLQAVKMDPAAGEAVKAIIVPEAKLAEQVLGQFMLGGLLVTVPAPLPVSITERVKATVVPSITVTLPLFTFAT